MMLRTRRIFTEEFKKAAVDRVLAGEKVGEVAKEFGIARSALYGWLERSEGKERLPKAKTIGEKKTDREEKTGGAKRRYTEEYKRAVAQQVKDGRSAPRVAEACGIGSDLLYKWVHRYFPELRKPLQKVGLEDLKPFENRLGEIEGRNQKSVQEQIQRVDTTLTQEEAKREKKESEKERAEQEEKERVEQMLADPMVWLQKHTQTKDSHWRESGVSSPYRAFPDKPYFRPLLEVFQSEPVVFLEKSRDMMISWLFVGFFTHAAMTTAGIEVLFQSQKIEKAKELIQYARTLYQRQDAAIRKAYPLKRGKKADDVLEFEHGSRIIAIPGGGDQVRSYHPWGLFQDEAAFMPEAGEAYDHAVPVCEKIVVVSSAGPGWFSEQCQRAEDVIGISLPKGVGLRRMEDGRPVYRVHYSADPERGAAWVSRERKKYSSQAPWDREQEIIHEAGGGERLFAEVLNRWGDRIIIDSPQFQASPHWKLIGGFDHGKANPTAALVGRVDFDGNLYLLAEYYQPGLSPKEHKPQLARLQGFLQAEVIADPSIFYKSHTQTDGSFKAISELYAEEGIANLYPAPENNELLGMERILAHWINLEEREPTLRIVCPRHKREIQKPIYGLHNDGCPNLLWELRRARRRELSAVQLVNRNPTEQIVDKDNHLRDALKYMVLSLPEPAKQTALAQLQAATGRLDVSSFMTHHGYMLPSVFAKEEKPIYVGRRTRFLAKNRERKSST